MGRRGGSQVRHLTMGTLLFDADVATHGIRKYEDHVHPERITVVDDPILGAGRKVMRFDVQDADTGPTANPRAQVCSPRILRDGDDVWFGWCTLFPEWFPERLPAGQWPFLTLAEMYGPPYGGSSPARLGMRPDTAAISLLSGKDGVLWESGPIRRNTWYDFALHERITPDPGSGLVELWLNTGQGWQREALHRMATLSATNGGGPNYHKLSSYRYAGMVDVLTVYQGEHRIGSAMAEVAPASHGLVLS